MSKPNNPPRLAENEAKAVARMLRVSPQKLNLLAQLIRGKRSSARSPIWSSRASAALST